MVSLRPLLLAALVLAPVRADAVGYGRFRWGESVEACRKKEPRLRPRPDAEPVAQEREVLALERREQASRARARGPDAYARWKELKQPEPRLDAHGYWLELAGLPARVTLLFIDDKLFGADVGILFAADRRDRASRVLDLLVEKYGPPTAARGGDPPDQTSVREHDTGDGTLTVFVQPPADDAPGLLRLRYRSIAHGRVAERYVEDLRGRRARAEREREERRRERERQRREERVGELLEHL